MLAIIQMSVVLQLSNERFFNIIYLMGFYPEEAHLLEIWQSQVHLSSSSLGLVPPSFLSGLSYETLVLF